MLINWYKRWVSRRSLKSAVRRANKYAKQTGRRYYVVRLSISGLAVVDNAFMKVYNRKAAVKINAHQLQTMALYSTSWTTKRK